MNNDNNSNQQAAQGRSPQVISPSVDAVQEFKVQTATFDAQFGNTEGGVTSISIKSGTNRFRGSELFLRAEVLQLPLLGRVIRVLDFLLSTLLSDLEVLDAFLQLCSFFSISSLLGKLLES